MTLHTFDSTQEAYGDVQCDDNIRNGDTLVVECEQVVGLAWTWPVAVTQAHGDLHTMIPTPDALGRVMTDAGWSVEHVKAAVAEADRRGWPVRPEFRSV